MKRLLLIVQLFLVIKAPAQDTLSAAKNPFTFSGSADIYYQYDHNKPASKERPLFLYNFKKHNQINVKLVLLKGAY